MRVERELMRGAGPVAVLKMLESGSKYGYELVDMLSKSSGGVLAMGKWTLCPLLYNLEGQGLVRGQRRQAPNGRQRKYYALTDQGKRRLANDTRQWQAVAGAMRALGILQGAEGAATAAVGVQP